MGKLVSAAIVLFVGLSLYGALRRRREFLPLGLGTVVPRAVLAVAVDVPALIFLFSIFRVIPAGQVGAASKDLQAVHVDMVLNHRVPPDRAPEVYKSLGLGYSSVIIDPGAQEILKANTATRNAAEILLKRPIIRNEVQQALTAYLNIRFDPAYNGKVSASLTPVLIQQQYLARWDGGRR